MCGAIMLPPRITAEQRLKLAAEVDAAPADAVWPDVLTGADGVARQVRACQAVKP